MKLKSISLLLPALMVVFAGCGGGDQPYQVTSPTLTHMLTPAISYAANGDGAVTEYGFDVSMGYSSL
jgi:hypothetical protein